MREVFLLLSLLALGCSSAEIEATSAPAVESEAESSHLGLTSPETQDLRNVLATSLPPTSEKPDALLNASQEEGEKQSSPLATKEAQGLQTTAEQKIPLALTVTPSPGNNSDGGSPNGKRFILPSNAGVPPPYHPWNRLPPKEVSEKNQGTTVSRSSRHSDDSSKQNADLKKPSFETTRGKNWCAYVHTRLQPTIVVDNIETYASGRAKPCTWIAGPCGSSSQSRTRQAYRVKHMIVTSLDWKCCPGYSGATCQPKAQEDQLLLHSNQAESNAAVGGGTPGSPEQQQQDPSDPAVAQKMNEQISSQEMRLTLLQKKVDNISAVVSDVSETLSSLEGKINEDKGRDFQAFLKDLKSKSIAELVKEIVREQVKASQSETQETVAQIFKITSGLSADLENIKQTIKSLNASHNKLAREIESRPTRIEILDIRTQILHIEEDISITCEKPIEDLQEHQRSIEAALEHQSSRSNVYYESLNRTLTQMKEVHEQLLTAERISDQNIPTAGNSITDNLTDYMVGLHEKVKTQSLMVLQLYDDLRVQDSKISNLTIALEIQRDNLHGECSSILSKCRRDFQTRLKGMEENMHSLNKSMENLVFPLDDKMDKMNEQINDLCYDMEILQPLIEQGVPFSLTSEYEQQIATEAISRKLENLTSVVAGLSSTTEELVKSKKELKDEAQAYNEISERRINECFILMEDGLNKTMMVINSAIDTIQDNYVLKETLSTMKNETKACCSSAEKMESILTLIPRFQEMNESLQVLVNENRKGVFTSNAIHSSSSSSGDLSIVRHNLNATLNLQEHHHDIGHLDGKGSGSTQEHEDYEGRLAAVEAKITKFLANNCVTVRNIKAASTEKDKVISLQVQALSSRIRALEAKSIRFSVTIPVLNKTAYEARSLCEVVSGSLKGMNASIPRLVKAAHPDNLLFQKGLQELTESMLEVKAGTILSNLTWYVDKSLDEAVDTITKRLKATPPVSKKPLPVKKIPVSTTANQAGRMQRNTDTASEADFTKGSYRYAPMVAFFASHTYGMNTPGPIRYNNLDVNYGSSYVPANGRFRVPYLGIYVFEYTIESNSPLLSGYLVVDGIDKLGFRSENTKENKYLERVVTGDALLELNYGQEVWLRLATGSIPAKYPPVTTFTGYILYRT
ncbi:multimerin-1 isoform X1 [Podarcis raffonei]|uniref:multimerin-1 isoform X1 n=1 Tax=Podarcis raffonei TaxID=65483 RepID=UPI0023290DCB|nr:multimerin-1 isoform X1 [Podarcis raffonei]